MSEDINIESIRKGDRVKVSLYGLPESGWLTVEDVGEEEPYAVTVAVVMPNTARRRVYSSEVTAHEPAAPALPDWWGAKVILGPPEGHGVSIGGGYVFPNDSTHIYGPDDCEGWAVQVIVDRNGNQPAAIRADSDRMWEDRRHIEEMKAERDEARANRDEERELRKRTEEERDVARADLEAFRAEVAKIRDFLASRADEQRRREHIPFERGASYVGNDAANRLSAILDGTDQ